ncbi:MAG: zinc-ribbon and DUF3426 domain-containing protein [Motiliproteus sp.]|nr:zinc-ribbon and DUF3426 domain-containing protein [Motiliproteus sp.]MCW9053867.1 zinc-ribbon and DUF3426 domain-containing protein [Motiliproteus sp.]
MSKHYVTQCPECSTRFQVSIDQLNKAQGLVRCGSCMAVFPADQHLESADDSAGSEVIRRHDNEADKNPIPEIPLQLQTVEKKDSTLSYLGWCLLTPLAISSLGLQILWFERDKLSRHPQLNPLYTQACEHLDCQLNARQDLPSIHSHHIIVRDHPKYMGALSVDLLIENQAPFEQPFPALQLVFSDLNGDPKAARVFQPRQYLAGDFDDKFTMPSGKQIQLQLEIIEASPKAPNYSLSFVPAKL